MFSSNTSQVADGGYQISRSLRFNSADSAYLNRTPASAGNRKTWTLSLWFKRSALPSSGYQSLIGADSGGGQSFYVAFDNSSQQLEMGQGASVYRKTTQVFRDPSAWYHIVVALDTTQATADDRIKIYANGTQITAFGTTTNPSQNADLAWNSNVGLGVGADITTSGARNFFNGYMTEVNFIDGQQLTPSSFGETNAQTGVWQPKAYAGSYGTNGFYLNFSDNSNTTAATLGKDYSGNGNNWTPNNFSVAAGAGNDSLVDTPTPYGSGSAGGDVRGNYCTWNPLAADSSATITNGNLDVATAAAGVGQARGTIGVSSGKWYWEVTRTTTGANLIAGIIDSATGADKYPGQTSGSYGYYGLDGTKINNGSFSSYGASFGIGDVIGVALDLDAGTLVFYKNGTSQGTAFTGLSGTFFPAASDDTGGAGMSYVGNFGQRPFAYTAPSGFKALCTQNLPTPTIGATTATQAGKYFNAVTYTANASGGGTVTGVGFQPDFTWFKVRSQTGDHVLSDVLRGSNLYLVSNATAPDQTYSGIWTANSDGWTSSNGSFYANQPYVGWNWKANGSGVTNTAGSITSTVSANTTAGFSVVTYTNAASGTVGHGLGVAPVMVIYKDRITNGNNWVVLHQSLGNMTNSYLTLNTSNSVATGISLSAAPTSTVISTSSTLGGSGNAFVAYCFAEVPGYSRFGSYVANGSADGPFVYTGFRPKFLLIKVTTAAIGWSIEDGTRSPSNAVSNILYPNLSLAEDVGPVVDFLSNGFKIRTTSGTYNDNGNTYVYAAFAESPFKYSLAR